MAPTRWRPRNANVAGAHRHHRKLLALNDQPTEAAYIGAIPIFPTTSDHFKISDAMNLLRSSGPRSVGSAPCSAKNARTFGSFVASCAAAYNLSTRVLSMLAGASNASHA